MDDPFFLGWCNPTMVNISQILVPVKTTSMKTEGNIKNTSNTGSIPSHDTKVNSAFHPSEVDK